MPEPDQITRLRALQPTDDGAAAAMATPETHTELIEAIVGSAIVGVALEPSPGRRARHPFLSVAALSTIAAALLIMTPGLLSGGGSTTQPQAAQAEILRRVAAAFERRPGTIVVQAVNLQVRSSTGREADALPHVSLTTLAEASANGTDKQALSTSPLAPGYALLEAGSRLELYDPSNRTIYVTTGQAFANAHPEETAPPTNKMTHPTVGRVFRYAAPFSPVRGNAVANHMTRRIFSLRGRTTVDGHPALKLVADHGTLVEMNPENGAYEIVRTLYLAPGSYAPIKQIATIRGNATLVTTWSLYRVIRPTSANRWLVSLTARHPHARIVHSAAALLAVWSRRP